MRNNERQIKTDADINSILKAAAVQVFKNDEANVPSLQERVWGAEEPISTEEIHVDDRGFLTTQK